MSQSRAVYYQDKNGFGAHSHQGGDSTTEKSRLQQPVKLHPSWEENNLPDDELNFRHVNMADASLALNAPPDRYKFLYIVFLIHGIGVLAPWNMFINAYDYFIYHKFSDDYIGFSFPHSANFMQTLTFCSQIPAVFFSWLNIFVQMGGNLTIRIVWSIGAVIVLFVITVLMAMIDTSDSPYSFFYATLVIVVLLNGANAIYQNTVFGITAKLPFKYTGALILGNNICGVFTSVISLLSKLGTPNLKMAAIYYFITAIFILLVCFDTYFALPLNKCYRHFDLNAKKEQAKIQAEQAKIPYWLIFKQSFPQQANVFMLFFVTLSVFPAIQVGVGKSDPNFFVSDEFYVDIMCFLNFNVFAMIGSWIPTFILWPGPKMLWIPMVLRFLYIPLLLFCNYQIIGEERVLPVLIDNDYAYFFIAATMALTSGYFSSLAMMYAPGTVEERYADIAGMFAGASLITGIFVGILSAFLWPWFITHVGK